MNNFNNDFLILSSGVDGRIETSVMRALYDIMSAISSDFRVSITRVNGFFPELAVFSEIKRSRVIIIHSPLLLSFVLAIFSRFLGIKVWALVWDKYPVLINGKRFDASLRRRILDVIENISLKMCSRIFVPSADFLNEPRFKSATVIKLWPHLVLEARARYARDKDGNVPIFLFSGQVNSTRGIQDAIQQLRIKTKEKFKLLIASQNAIPYDISNDPNVCILGYCSQASLKKYCALADFGLVSLSSGFQGPAFPSKTLMYVAEGLPVVYHGPQLPFFLHTLKASGVGFDLGGVKYIDRKMSENIRIGYDKKIEIFNALSCISAHEVREKIFKDGLLLL